MGRIAGSILLLCLMSFADANTSPEIITSLVQIKEDTPRDHHAFTINATDAEDDPLTYGLIGSNAYFFSVNSSTGEVKVLTELDRETLPVFTVTAIVSDPSNTTPKDITIVLLDANDNDPIFQNTPYNFEYAENTPVGKTLFKTPATDADTGVASFVKYSIEEVIPSDGASLFSITDTTAEVILNGSLNYNAKSTFYRIKIKAYDGGGEDWEGTPVFRSSIAFALLTVLDVPDLDPQFIRVPYTAAVEEGSPVGQFVFKVFAIDQDTGISDDIIYSIESSTAEGLFEINGNNGEILVKSDIDREAISDRGVVTLTVKATEANPNIHGVNANTTTDVQITIIDINDNKPKFYMCGDTCVLQNTFTAEILEHSSGTIFINMTVIDKDQGGRIKLTLDGVDKEVFSVSPTSTVSESTVQLMVKRPLELDFEKKEFMVVKVIAEDQDNTTLRSTATVTIAIKDDNDNSPKFSQDTYKLQVLEHSPVGTELATITATDLDQLDEGKITYRLLPDSIWRYFDVEPYTGMVYVTNSSLIDREVRAMYSATLLARDSINSTGTTVLEITLIDINDQQPVMNRKDYFALVIEGEQLELLIEATDKDDPDTPNSQIVYGIVPSKYSENFTINPNTGVLTNNGELDREAMEPDLKGKIELVVTATDKGDEPLNATAKVIIEIQDIDDNTPEFKNASYKFYVEEGKRGVFVGSVYAEDLDQTQEFNRISFTITGGSIGSFIIRGFLEDGSYRGDISVDPDVELDYESAHKSFKLQVEAENLDQTAVVGVEVEVVDVNDERPEFKPADPITVKENTTITGAIGNFTAQDKDGNHSLVFELVSIMCRCNGTEKPCDWFTLEDTGDIIANAEHTVDYELCDQVLMEAQVVDEYTQKGENNSVTLGKMEINIEDINDNAPQFILSDSVFVVVSESASKDTAVASVTATDRDSLKNRDIKFAVTNVRFRDTNNQTSEKRKLFEAETRLQVESYVGLITPREELETALKGKYLVTVEANDTGGLSTTTVLEIFTVDISFKIELRFVSSVEQVQANKDAIIRDLTVATNANIKHATIRPYTPESRAPQETVMEAYFIYPNGTAIDSDTVKVILSEPEHFLMLSKYGLTYIGNVPVEPPPELDPVIFVLLGLVGGMIIVLAVLTTSLVCTRRSYRTKLKAANAMKSAAMVVTESQKSGAVVPGTNKYTMEGANPVLNLNIDAATDLGFDEEGSNFDKVSLNSLDYNIDMIMPEKDTMPMMMIQEEEEENGEPDYIEPLGAALAQRGLKNFQKSSPLTFDNPAVNTTDL